MAKAKKTIRDLIDTETQTDSANKSLQVQNVLLKEIYPSDSNPRKTMNEDAIIDLAKSMHDVGLLQPITIRPGARGKYEIVAGHRRYEAAVRLKWHSIPSIIREVGDEQILEIQIIENLQREDVSPMDEAAAFQSILKRESFDWLCSRIHKSQKYISDRLKLNDLVEKGQEYVHQGILPITHAIMISKLPADEQGKCIEECIEEDFNSGGDFSFCAKTVHDLREFIQDKLMIDLDRACFDLEDSELVPAAGACAACPKRTGNQNLLFQEITEEDQCTDAACYHLKEKAHVDATIKKAKEDHGKDSVLTGSVDRYGNSMVKVKGVNIPFKDKPTKGKDQVCVVITKDDGFSIKQSKLGNTLWIDRDSLEGKVKQKEENKSSGFSTNRLSWQEQQKNEFKEIVHPRLLKIASLLEGDSILNAETIALTVIKARFDKLPLRDVVAFASIVGLYTIAEDKLWEGDDEIDWEVGLKIIEMVINHIHGKGLAGMLSILALLDAVDDTDEIRTEEEKVLVEEVNLNWNELMELIEGKKAKPAKKNVKK